MTIINQYLEIMDTGQALTRFFQRDSTKANNLTLYPHKEEEFWLWVSSWAVFVSKPSDVNADYSDEGYDLPPLKINYHRLDTVREEFETDKWGQAMLFSEATNSLADESMQNTASPSIMPAPPRSDLLSTA